MIKMIAAGVWACIVALGAAYGAVLFTQQPAKSDKAEHDKKAGLETVKLKPTSVPIIIDGAIAGYVMAQLAFVAETKLLKQQTISPETVIADEAFRTIYASEIFDFRKMRKQDLGVVSKVMLDNVNKRFGQDIVREVLIQELMFVPKEQVRKGGNQG